MEIGPRTLTSVDGMETNRGSLEVRTYARTINGKRFEFSVSTLTRDGHKMTEYGVWSDGLWEATGLPLHLL